MGIIIRCARFLATNARSRYFNEIALKQLPELGNLYCFERRGKAVCIAGTDHALAVPSAVLACAILAEWRGFLPSEASIVRVRSAEDPLRRKTAIPLTRLVLRAMALCRDADTHKSTCKSLAAFVHSDALCYVDQRDEHVSRFLGDAWRPLVSLANSIVGSSIRLVDSQSLAVRPQAAMDETAILNFLYSRSPYWIAGAEHVVHFSKSIVLALALEHVTLDCAAAAALAESNVQQHLRKHSDAFTGLGIAAARRELALARALMSCCDSDELPTVS